MSRNIRILGTGKYLPSKIVTSEELDRKLGLKEGWAAKKSGVKIRHVVDGEVNSDMAVKAIEQALKNANMTKEDLHCIISTSASFDQPLPCQASLIKEKMVFKNHPIPAFDIDSTCLGFVVGLDTISYLVEAERYKNVVIVSSEISSLAINPNQHESYTLFGDGACAVIISKSSKEETSSIKTSLIETYPEGVHMTEVRGGGSILHSRHYSEKNKTEYLFDMDGRAIFRLSSRLINGFMERLFKDSGLTIQDIDMVIPHQASAMAMKLMRKKLDVPEEKFMSIIENHGNVISASIPMALHEAIVQNRIKRGDKVLLLGTSAGLSLGGLVFEY
ncbi:beta-ketoacyl-ACP synthase III [Halalkalibacter nanhaiisediminis]|uniref:3-oxoacyl-[acyl-carrier-protein] synthase-3 n=1 Tax=Halalkalibacter nanhaiisediminis TaxID=688079 RepID=A0A562QMV3_9BACI|nr:beta-ketoacyl-ACP synthase III [Halalkalibacter nanhaiisediminis]TWI58069.1 3-oxoacyl-[acyl-carrier-protein] synthase-3 [Halalkalibacter nanhaiisediminis]